MKQYSLGLVAALWLSSASFAAAPRTINFRFANQKMDVTAAGTLSFQKNPSNPVYRLSFKNNGQPTTADLTIYWDGRREVTFEFLHNGNGKTCTGSASLQGGAYQGTMKCGSDLYGASIE